MSESTVTEQIGHHWYARPVFFVADVQRALRFYREQLGFTREWQADNVCQVDRGGCEIILFENTSRKDKSRLFVELNRDGMDELRREISERSVPHEEIWWGYDTIRIVDPEARDPGHLFVELKLIANATEKDF